MGMRGPHIRPTPAKNYPMTGNPLPDAEPYPARLLAARNNNSSISVG